MLSYDGYFPPVISQPLLKDGAFQLIGFVSFRYTLLSLSDRPLVSPRHFDWPQSRAISKIDYLSRHFAAYDSGFGFIVIALFSHAIGGLHILMRGVEPRRPRIIWQDDTIYRGLFTPGPMAYHPTDFPSQETHAGAIGKVSRHTPTLWRCLLLFYIFDYF